MKLQTVLGSWIMVGLLVGCGGSQDEAVSIGAIQLTDKDFEQTTTTPLSGPQKERVGEFLEAHKTFMDQLNAVIKGKRSGKAKGSVLELLQTCEVSLQQPSLEEVFALAMVEASLEIFGNNCPVSVSAHALSKPDETSSNGHWTITHKAKGGTTSALHALLSLDSAVAGSGRTDSVGVASKVKGTASTTKEPSIEFEQNLRLVTFEKGTEYRSTLRFNDFIAEFVNRDTTEHFLNGEKVVPATPESEWLINAISLGGTGAAVLDTMETD